jgi:hypothetical protein
MTEQRAASEDYGRSIKSLVDNMEFVDMSD